MMPLFIPQKPKKIPSIRWQDCAAKTTGISVLDHSRYTGEVARALVERLPESVVALLGSNPAAIAALHDVGKVSPGFQKKYFNDRVRQHSSELANMSLDNFEHRHAMIGEVALDAHSSSYVAAVAGAHHGVRNERRFSEGAEVVGGEGWATERRALIERLIDEFGPIPPDPPPNLSVLMGLVCIADWISSDERFFPHTSGDSAVEMCGWAPVKIKPGLSFKDLFIQHPYNTQREFFDLIDGPGVYVLETPTGSGKTEAALYAAYKLMEAGHNHGLYFGLPTRLTSDKIHERVAPFVASITDNQAGVRLAHGRAWLKSFEHGGGLFGMGEDWSRPSKRALLTPFAVGTIDQALMSVIKVKHHFIRSLGLAGKVVILDEVHSYDMYTGTLLDLLVQQLRELGCTVIILSATLTKKRRRSFTTHRRIDKSPIKQTPVRVKFCSPHEWDWSAAVEKARAGQQVLCVANTVDQAQDWFDQITAHTTEFPVGLLHARLPAWQREELEDYWMKRLGKDRVESQGCILVATQVVEQSVDIDVDVLITELAPTDMLLQRLGRLWRHLRSVRPCDEPYVHILSECLDDVTSYDELVDTLGRANSLVYDPYVLWRTYQVWRSLVMVDKPGRELLEATYAEHPSNAPDFINQALEKLEKRKKRLRRMAHSARSDVSGFCTTKDNERAATRHSGVPTVEAVLAHSVEYVGTAYNVVLSSGETVRINPHSRVDGATLVRLCRNLIPIRVGDSRIMRVGTHLFRLV